MRKCPIHRCLTTAAAARVETHRLTSRHKNPIFTDLHSGSNSHLKIRILPGLGRVTQNAQVHTELQTEGMPLMPSQLVKTMAAGENHSIFTELPQTDPPSFHSLWITSSRIGLCNPETAFLDAFETLKFTCLCLSLYPQLCSQQASAMDEPCPHPRVTRLEEGKP